MTADVDAERPSMRVVQFVADRKDVDPLELEPLGHVIDPEALDALVETLDDDEHVRFEYLGVILYVWGDDEITAEDV